MPVPTNKILIVYHVSVVGWWQEIIEEQLRLLHVSGLGTACEKIYVQLCGIKNESHFEQVKTHFTRYPFYPKIQFKYINRLDTYEYPSINQVQRVAKRNPTAHIFYFHTKGASHGKIPPNLHWKPQQVENMKQWRRCMEYFTITKWRDCQEALRYYDCCGIDWVKGQNWAENQKEGDFHYSGNFWWATASYINRCTLRLGSRYNCEFFIGTGKPKAYEIFSAVKNPRLRQYFDEETLKKMFYSTDYYRKHFIFNWWNNYYDEKYYK